jgi:hypothetical protein
MRFIPFISQTMNHNLDDRSKSFSKCKVKIRNKLLALPEDRCTLHNLDTSERAAPARTQASRTAADSSHETEDPTSAAEVQDVIILQNLQNLLIPYLRILSVSGSAWFLKNKIGLKTSVPDS